MLRPIAAALLVAGVALAGVAAAQNRMPDRALPGGADATDKSDQVRRQNDRLPDREIPQLQDRGGIGGPPPAIRDRFESYCKTRGGCPGGYAQHQGAFNAFEQQQQLDKREETERRLQRQQQPGSGTRSN